MRGMIVCLELLKIQNLKINRSRQQSIDWIMVTLFHNHHDVA